MNSTDLLKKIEALEEKRKKLQAQAESLKARAKSDERKKENARKYALAGALLKLSENNVQAHEILTMCFNEAKKARPKPFEGAALPPAPPRPTPGATVQNNA